MHTRANHIVSDSCAQLTKALHHLFPSLQAGDIHRFRVEYKKLRALLRLMNSSGIHQQDVMPAGLKSLYKSLGILRDIQLQQARVITRFVDRLQLVQSYLHQLYQASLPVILSFRERKIISSGKKSIRAIRKNNSSHITEAMIRTFTDARVDWMTRMLQQLPVGEADWHQARKYMKDMLYIEKAGIRPGKISGQQDAAFIALIELTDLLGEYQDRVSCANHLETYLEKQPAGREKDSLLLMLYETRSDQDRIGNRMAVMLNDYLQSHYH